MFGYVKAVELATTKNITATTGVPSGTYTINYNGMKARLISGQEAITFGKIKTWLYQNLSKENTTTKPFGYWTDTAVESDAAIAWNLHYPGLRNNFYVNYAINYGVRPVARVLKSNI